MPYDLEDALAVQALLALKQQDDLDLEPFLQNIIFDDVSRLAQTSWPVLMQHIGKQAENFIRELVDDLLSKPDVASKDYCLHLYHLIDHLTSQENPDDALMMFLHQAVRGESLVECMDVFICSCYTVYEEEKIEEMTVRMMIQDVIQRSEVFSLGDKDWLIGNMAQQEYGHNDPGAMADDEMSDEEDVQMGYCAEQGPFEPVEGAQISVVGGPGTSVSLIGTTGLPVVGPFRLL